MDLSLGGPVEVPNRTSKFHKGNCNDSMYGCTKCHNAKDTMGDCEWCGVYDKTLIVKAWDEPVLYELCANCVKSNRSDAYDDTLYDDRLFEDDSFDDDLGLQYSGD